MASYLRGGDFQGNQRIRIGGFFSFCNRNIAYCKYLQVRIFSRLDI